MELQFEHSQFICNGKNPTAVHFETNNAQVFYVGADNKIYAISTETPLGEWENRQFSNPVLASTDENVKYMSLKSFPRFGVYGTWHSDDRHRFAIYEFETILGEYLEEANITSIIDNPIEQFQLTLANADEGIIGEDESLLTPGARLYFAFKAGDSDPYEMGTFYVDGSDYTVGDAETSASGRNTIGKSLNDQSFGENTHFSVDNLKTVLTNILQYAGIPDKQIMIQDTTLTRGMDFAEDTKILDGIQEILNTVSGWKIQELTDGAIVIGHETYEKFPQPSRYTFYRDKDIFSRKIKRDDAEVYARVCVSSNTTGSGTGTVATSGSVLNIRPEPNTTKPAIGSLENGATVTVLLEAANGWLQIQTIDDIIGYVSGKYINWTKQTTSKIVSYANVPYYEEFGLPKNKIKFLELPDGYTQEELDLFAVEIAERIGMGGIIESFTGAFRPHIQKGDEAEIISESGRKILGLITDISHTSGKSGYYTNFTVDSGGTITKGRMSTYISKISAKKNTGGSTRLY